MDVDEAKALRERCNEGEYIHHIVTVRYTPRTNRMKLCKGGPIGEWIEYIGYDEKGDRFLCRFESARVLKWLDKHFPEE